MPSNPYEPASDNSDSDPAKQLSGEQIYGRKPEKQPPLPEVEGLESAPIPEPRSYSHSDSVEHNHQNPEHQTDSAADSGYPIKRRFNWGRLFTMAIIGCISAGAIWYIWITRQQMVNEAAELSFKPIKARLTLQPDQPWQEFAFILRPGDQVAITASGEYQNSKGGKMSANGSPQGPDGENSGSRSLDPIFPHGCLVARTSGKPSEVFHIGTGGIVQTDRGGRLQVQLNDLDLYDNFGELILEARTFFPDPPTGVTNRGSRDSDRVPIKR